MHTFFSESSLYLYLYIFVSIIDGFQVTNHLWGIKNRLAQESYLIRMCIIIKSITIYLSNGGFNTKYFDMKENFRCLKFVTSIGEKCSKWLSFGEKCYAGCFQLVLLNIYQVKICTKGFVSRQSYKSRCSYVLISGDVHHTM